MTRTVTNIDENDEVRDSIAQQLLQTPFACSSLTRLSGGTANFVYRGTLSSTTPDCIIIKHSKDYLPSNPNFKLDPTRCVSLYSSGSCHHITNINGF